MDKLEETFLQNLEKMTDFVDRIENDLTQLKSFINLQKMTYFFNQIENDLGQLKSFINLQKIKYSSRRESQEDENDFLRIEAYYSTNHHEGPSTATATPTSNTATRRRNRKQEFPYYNEVFNIYNAAEDEEEVDDKDPLQLNDHDVKYLPSMLEKQSQNLNYQMQLCDSLNTSISHPHPPNKIRARNRNQQPKKVKKGTKRLKSIKITRAMNAVCPEPGCSYETIGYSNMRAHVVYLHPFSNHPGYPVWRCEFCNFPGISKLKLINHLKKNHKNEGTVFDEKLKALLECKVTPQGVSKSEMGIERKSRPKKKYYVIRKVKVNPNLQKSSVLIHQKPNSNPGSKKGRGRPKKIQILDTSTNPNHPQTQSNTNTNSNEIIETGNEQSNNEKQNTTTVHENESTNEIAISHNNTPTDPVSMDL